MRLVFERDQMKKTRQNTETIFRKGVVKILQEKIQEERRTKELINKLANRIPQLVERKIAAEIQEEETKLRSQAQV